MTTSAPGKLVTLVTGTRKGIGADLARHYLSQGHRVFGCSRGAGSIEHEDYTHIGCDVADEAQVAAMLERIRQETGRLDHLIHNAGIASANHTLLTSAEMAERLLRTNVLGTFLVCREAAKLMKGGGAKRIVTFSSITAPLRLAGSAMYGASKSAVETFSLSLAKELGPLGITVNVIGPNSVRTELLESVSEDVLRRVDALQSIRGFSTIDDIAGVCDFFLHPRSRMVTGQVIYLGGHYG